MFAAVLASSLVILSICEMKCNQIEPLNKKQIEKKRNFVEFRIFFSNHSARGDNESYLGSTNRTHTICLLMLLQSASSSEYHNVRKIEK